MKNSRLRDSGAVILAGGFGTRLREQYPSIPKPMIEVSGLPFVEWVIKYLAGQGIRDICLSIGYKADIIEEYLRKRPGDGLNITSMKEGDPQGTAGGFLLAASKFKGKKQILALNGDSLTLAALGPAFDLLEGCDAAILGVKVDDCSRYGSLKCDADGFLLSFAEKRSGAGLINAGVYLFAEKTLRAFPGKRPLSFEYDVFPVLLVKGMKIRVYETDAPFIDIGTPESVKEAEAFIDGNMSKFVTGTSLVSPSAAP